MRHRGHGPKRTAELHWRVEATKRTIERYRGKAFDWATGVTCAHLLRFHLRNMGHRPPTLPRFRSALAAKRALAEHGWATVPDMLDALLPRLTRAQMMLGDVAVMEGADMGSVFICVGPRRVFGWIEGNEQPVTIEPDMEKMLGAWGA